MKWSDERIAEFLTECKAICPALTDMTTRQLVEFAGACHGTGAPYHQMLDWVGAKAMAHRKGDARPQPGDLLAAFKAIANQEQAIRHGGVSHGNSLSHDAGRDLPAISERFARHPAGSRTGFYGAPVVYAGAKPWPPVGVIESAYREARAHARDGDGQWDLEAAAGFIRNAIDHWRDQ